MPQATNLVIKNAAAVDKTFALLTPAAGDKGIAEWALKEGLISSIFPRLTAEAHRTNNASRKANLKLRVPSSYTDAVTGLTKVGSSFEAHISVSVPDDFPEALRDDAAAFVTNGLKTTLLTALIRDAYPAT